MKNLRCRVLEDRIRVLEAELQEATTAKDKSAVIEKALKRSKDELEEQKSALEAKLSTLEDALSDRNDLEIKWKALQDEKDVRLLNEEIFLSCMIILIAL